MADSAWMQNADRVWHFDEGATGERPISTRPTSTEKTNIWRSEGQDKAYRMSFLDVGGKPFAEIS
jgi:hypothetical protein